jgi:hypothetical protein
MNEATSNTMKVASALRTMKLSIFALYLKQSTGATTGLVMTPGLLAI